MGTKPKVSIIMPVYNAAKYLNKSINSILNQSLKEIELICINDKSKDNSLKKLKEFQKKDSRIKIINNKKNCGPGESRNNGIKKAKGEYICFVDSDDWLEKNACELLYNNAKKNNSDIVFIRPKFIFTNKIILDKRLLKDSDFFDNEKILKKTLQREVAWAPWSKLIKRNLLIKNKIFFPSIYIGEDMDFSVKTIFYAKKISTVKNYLYNYYLHEGSLMSFSNPKRRIENYFQGIKLIKDFLISKKIYKKYKKEYIKFKYYNYLAITGVLEYTKEKIDKKQYKQKIFSDSDVSFSKILSNFNFNSTSFGIFLLYLNIFGISLRLRDKLRFFLGNWGNKNS